ncbi:regulator of nonsense transcripts 3B [Amia ocellicauda]|uniref:regulator of nonsense transcripts 3B n=1 Tax=Amia ocellicauda TaxID=2972642 RepID=UPI00346420DD
MKEDKENARPKEKKVDIRCEDNEKPDKATKERREAMTKIVIRRLPPSLTKEQLEEQLQPLPEVDYLEFFANDTSLYPHLFSRAYINFKNQEDIVLFRDRFDGYVFIDNRGQEYPAIVEFAPFQKIAKKKSKKKDAKAGTIEEDPDYKKFLENYNGDEEKLTSTPETLLEELEARTKELVAKKTTPLLDFLKNKQRIREEKREERRRRELERKRLRDEERRKWREEDRRKRKEVEKHRRGDKNHDKDRDKSKEEPKIKLLRKPEKGDDVDPDKPKEKVKKAEKEKIKEERAFTGGELKKRPNSGIHEDRKKVDEDGRKDYRERDVDRDRDRDRDRRQKEKERIRRQDEERRRRRDRHEVENTYRRRDEDGKKEKDHTWEKKKSENAADSTVNSDKPERATKDDKKDEPTKRDRLRNKDRPAIQLYQPGARSRIRTTDPPTGERKAESETKSAQEKGEE